MLLDGGCYRSFNDELEPSSLTVVVHGTAALLPSALLPSMLAVGLY